MRGFDKYLIVRIDFAQYKTKRLCNVLKNDLTENLKSIYGIWKKVVVEEILKKLTKILDLSNSNQYNAQTCFKRIFI